MATRKTDTKDPSTPTSFRLSDEAIAALDKGSNRFRMNRTQWLEWLALSAVADKEVSIANEDHTIIMRPKK